jgi:molecular chaperone GrpE
VGAGFPGRAKPRPENRSLCRLETPRENAELKDKVLRTLAEMENQRRRAEREIADAKFMA